MNTFSELFLPILPWVDLQRTIYTRPLLKNGIKFFDGQGSPWKDVDEEICNFVKPHGLIRLRFSSGLQPKFLKILYFKLKNCTELPCLNYSFCYLQDSVYIVNLFWWIINLCLVLFFLVVSCFVLLILITFYWF